MARPDVDQLEARTRQFAVDVMRLCESAARQPHLWSLCQQLCASAGSVSANHRAMTRSRSIREFAAKLQVVHEEADETVHWLSVLRDTNRDARVAELLPSITREAECLRNLFGRARATTRRRFPPGQR